MKRFFSAFLLLGFLFMSGSLAALSASKKHAPKASAVKVSAGEKTPKKHQKKARHSHKKHKAKHARNHKKKKGAQENTPSIPEQNTNQKGN